MQVVRALFDGHDIKPIETIRTKNKTEVLVIFPNPAEEISPAKARRLLRGSGRGEKLTEKLLKSRADDIKYDTR
jgi:phage gp29-like protein